MKSFDIPSIFNSSFIGSIKELRKKNDPRKKDYTPTLLNFGGIQFILARHFGFCYGVENAIERAYKAIKENPDKRIFLLSQMIHNPAVNDDLQAQGITFIMDTHGNQLIDWNEITKEDVVLIPAFGTTLEIEALLIAKGIDTITYNTTCPFVEKVWNRSEKLSKDAHTIIIHGKPMHEETRATFSHAASQGPAIVLKDIHESKLLARYILGELSLAETQAYFNDRISKNFDFETSLLKVGVVNQTTMLASETQEIAEFFKTTMIQKYGEETISSHYADTRDTLCYATNDNQQATFELLKQDADLAIVVGGYNSSNTSHIVDLCAEKFNTYFIKSADEILSKDCIQHFNYAKKALETTEDFLKGLRMPKIILTSGASCPDTELEGVMRKLCSFYQLEKTEIDLLNELQA